MRYSTTMAQIHGQMMFEEYIDGVLQLDDEAFEEYYDSLDASQQQELEEVIGKIAKGIGKVAVSPITLPFKAVKGLAKGAAKVAKGAAKAVTSKPAKAAGSAVAKGAGAAAKGAVGGIKKLAKRLSTTGRADAAAKKADAIAKRTSERERLAKEKERVDTERQKAKDSMKKDIEKEKTTSAEYEPKDDKKHKDMKEDYETTLVEFTSSQIARLKKEYESLRGKETGASPEKFAKLRKIMDRFSKKQLLQLVKADIPILTSGAKSKLVIKYGMKWKQLPEELIPYIEVFASDEKELGEEKKSNFKEVDPKVIDRIEKMMRGSRQEKDSIANMLNYFMPPEVVDMVRYKLKIPQKRGKIKF